MMPAETIRPTATGLPFMEDIREFDLMVWTCARAVAQNNPALASRQFSLARETLAKLACAPDDRLRLLASGMSLSFRIRMPEDAIIVALMRDYDPLIFLHRTTEDVDTAFWLLMKSLAGFDVDMARIVFGVSHDLAAKVAAATDNRLRNLARIGPGWLEPACESRVVGELLDAEHTTRALLLFTKLQHCLNRVPKQSPAADTSRMPAESNARTRILAGACPRPLVVLWPP